MSRIIRTNTALLVLTASLLLQAEIAVAQHADHSEHQPPQSTVKQKKIKWKVEEKPQAKANDEEIDHSKMQHDEHEGMGHSKHEGMDHSKMQHDEHEGMDHSKMQHDASPITQPHEPIPALTDADRAAAFPKLQSAHDHGQAIHSYFLLDRLEISDADPDTQLSWEAMGWIGTDKNRWWLRSEGEREGSVTQSANIEVLYGRSITTWWDVVAGVRHDFKPAGAQSFAAIGVQGLAPQKFEIEATAYIGERGQTALQFEAEYDLLLTNRLILQPVFEASLYGKSDTARGIGSGLSKAEIGLRLRYEFTRKFAPYFGVVHERAFGNTADLRRQDSEPVDDTQVIAGFRTWF